jgi:hypothetical protein
LGWVFDDGEQEGERMLLVSLRELLVSFRLILHEVLAQFNTGSSFCIFPVQVKLHLTRRDAIIIRLWLCK